MKNNLRIISLMLTLIMITNLVSVNFANDNNSNDKVNIQIINKSDDGTAKRENGVISLNLGSELLIINYEEVIYKDKKVTTLDYNGVCEVIENNFQSDLFTVTRNNIKNEYSKKEIAENMKSLRNLNETDNLYSTMSLSSDLGTPYSDKEIAAKSFTWNGTKTARLKEYYYWDPTEYDSYSFAAFTAVSAIAGVLTLGVSTLFTAIASICAIVNGVLAITDALTLDYNAYRQDWNKWAIIDGDTLHYYHYHAGRTRIFKYFEFSTGTSITDVLSDTSTSNFYNNIGILDIAISNYKRQH